MSVEAVRLLAARSEHGYTDRLDRALPEEPEAVSADCQRQLTARAARSAEARARADWQEHVDRLRAELEGVRRLPYGRELAPELRLLQRGLDQLDRRALGLLTAAG